MTTTEGSIVAYIGANDDDYREKMRRAEATAEELGRTDPTVTVHANTSEAMAKLAAFRAEVAAARGESDPLNMAGLPMSAIRSDGSIKAADWVAAKQAQAARNAASANAASVQNAASGGGGGGIGFAGALGIGIAAVLPLLADLAGAAAAGAGAFMGMGAAGVLAVKGIKDEMAQGTAVGQQYQALFANLGDDMSTLEHTAAVGVLGGVAATVKSISQEMPSLNSEIDGFSRGLGDIAGTVVDGLVTGFRVLNPMFMTAEQYIAGVARQWDSWVHDGGLLQWGSDVEKVFPLVVRTVGDVAEVVLHLINALMPLGTVALNVLDGVAKVLDAIPVDVLTALASGALLGAAAFKSWQFIAPMLATVATRMGAVGASAEVMQAKAGIVGVAVGVLATAVAGMADILGHAQAQQDGYTYALQASNGAIDESIRKTAYKQLTDAGAIFTAHQMGIEVRDLVDAVTGQGDGLDRVNAKIAEYTDGTKVQRIEANRMKNLLGEQRDALSASAAAQKDENAAVRDSTSTVSTSVSAQQAAYYAAQATSQAYLTQASNANAVVQSVTNMIAALNTSTTADVSAIQTNATWEQSLAGIGKQVQQNGKSLDQNTASGSANAAMLATAAQNAKAAADAQYQVDLKTMSAKAATEKYVKTLGDSKTQLEQNAAKAGLNAQKVQAIADATLHIPDKKEMTVLVNTAQAQSQLAWLQGVMGNLHLNIPVSTVGPLAGGYGFAPGHSSGGPIYASMGMFVPQGTDTVPAMLTPGEMVIKRKSADYDPQFIRQYNDDPERALAGVRGGHGGTVQQTFNIQGVSQTDPHVLGIIIGNRARSAMRGIPGWTL